MVVMGQEEVCLTQCIEVFVVMVCMSPRPVVIFVVEWND